MAMQSAIIFTLYLFGAVALSPGEPFQVTTLRAAPGQLETLLQAARDYRQARQDKVLLMRHSQGDHWDLMLLEPAREQLDQNRRFRSLVDYQESFLAYSETPFAQLKSQAEKAGLFHIEMFNALAGKHEALMDQRRRENQYLENTGQTSNAVFVTRFGSDVDVFTIGFHKDMAALDAGPAVSDAKAEEVARAAGFKNRADLGFYLRELIIGHHDTLAVPVSD